jgi:hypothetical protein
VATRAVSPIAVGPSGVSALRWRGPRALGVVWCATSIPTMTWEPNRR